ncbi:MAG: hypothetical protein IJ143_09840 [Neisseriaceae bacterium]|nr:hypothetical protein [Neisseriaceae bacterium]
MGGNTYPIMWFNYAPAVIAIRYEITAWQSPNYKEQVYSFRLPKQSAFCSWKIATIFSIEKILQ